MSAIHFEVRQEDDVVCATTLLKVGVTSLVVGVVGVFFSSVVLVAATHAPKPSLAGSGGLAPMQTDLSQVEQTPIWDARGGEDRREAQTRELERWGWVDRNAGVANIPIDRAMDLVVRESR
jgi:hypothetical protein